MLEGLRKTVARAIAPPRKSAPRRTKPRPAAAQGAWPAFYRAYQAAKQSRLTAGFGTSTTSADSELSSSLRDLRNRCRALIRDAAYAKRAKVIVQNNVIGSGIGMQAQVMSTRDELREVVNDAIENAWCEWSCAEYCHTGGSLCFADLERAIMGQIFEAGEVFIRKHRRAFGGSAIPLALELIEAERLADELATGAGPAAPGTLIKMGIEQDTFGRPVAYWIRKRHPGEIRFIQGETDMVERVPAEDIMHLRLVDRWPQTRGEPWLHAVARKLNDMDAYSEAEVVAARANAVVSGTIETTLPDSTLGQDPNSPNTSGGGTQVELETGIIPRLAPGEKLTPYTPSRPNTALSEFMRAMLREMAAGAGVSYESLSRDYSQSNYSSSRLSLLDDRDSWKMLQQWYIRNCRLPLHKEWLQAAIFSGAVPVSLDEYGNDPAKFSAVLFKPRGWTWIDPTKEVEAAERALKAGFTTRADIIAATADGRDIEDIDRQRARELEKEEQLELQFTTSPSVYIPAETGAQKGTGVEGAAKEGEPGGPQGGDPPATDGNKPTKSGPPLRAVPFPAR